MFLSYSHADSRWARWLMQKLEGYAVPKRFHGRVGPIGEVGPRIAPVFRDRDELSTTSDLGETIRQALRESATLVVICSPAAARSPWVQEEIISFKRVHGERAVFAFIVAGEPKIPGAADDCFSPGLRFELAADGTLSSTATEVVAADARREGDRPKLAFLRLVAGLLAVGFDELRQRELQRRNRRLLVTTICAVAGMAVTLGLAVIAWQSRNEAMVARDDARRRQDQAEELHAFMLGDVRREVERVGRLDALEAVFNASMAYFGSLRPQDMTDTALARQAKSLTQLGEVRFKQSRLSEARRAFVTAYLRAAALAERQPKNADLLFERAQAEYWIGYVELRRGEGAAAATWFTRYRDSALSLHQLEPGSKRAESEVISGHRNLAALERDRGNFAAARAGFEAALAALNRMAAAEPNDFTLKFRVADTHSWLGSVALVSGDLKGATDRFAAQVRQLGSLCADDPGTMKWRFGLAEALLLQREPLANSGRTGEAKAALERANDLLGQLVQHDPSNREWASAALHCRLRLAAHRLAAGDVNGAHGQVQSARAALERLHIAEPTRRSFGRLLALAWRLEARCRQSSDLNAAAEAARQACELGESLAKAAKPEVWAAPELAQARVIAAQIDLAREDRPEAGRHLDRAIELVANGIATARDCRQLDAAARAFALAGRTAESREVISRLEALGYAPEEAWPATTALSGKHTQTTTRD